MAALYQTLLTSRGQKIHTFLQKYTLFLDQKMINFWTKKRDKKSIFFCSKKEHFFCSKNDVFLLQKIHTEFYSGDWHFALKTANFDHQKWPKSGQKWPFFCPKKWSFFCSKICSFFGQKNDLFLIKKVCIFVHSKNQKSVYF